jgi:beta-glucanase (GH16 family)
MPGRAPVQDERLQLVWQDEFDGPNGSEPDPTKWKAEIGGTGWGNRERQLYTAPPKNAALQDGMLAITARSERPGAICWYGNCQYTSARLVTEGRFTQRYGRIEARIKVPTGQGIWSAFWLLGDDYRRVGWPASGEIDIMEHLGHKPSTIYGTAHGPGYAGGESPLHAKTVLPEGQRFADDFHVFAIEWEPEVLRWYVDETLYQTRTPADLPVGVRWVYDHPFYLLLNVAVGGNWPGHPDATTRFPQTMLVDYVRVYQFRHLLEEG